MRINHQSLQSYLSKLKSVRKIPYVFLAVLTLVSSGDETYLKKQEQIARYHIERRLDRLVNQLGDIKSVLGDIEQHIRDHEHRIEGLEKAAEDRAITGRLGRESDYQINYPLY